MAAADVEALPTLKMDVLSAVAAEDDLYLRLKTLQRQIEFLDIQVRFQRAEEA